MNVLVTGGSGLLGTAILRHLGMRHAITSVTRTGGSGSTACDLTDPARTSRLFDERPFDVVLHAAAYSDVDGCERDPEAAWKANALAVRHVADGCRRKGIGLVHVSTDYVFDGRSGRDYREDDPVCPINAYGMSKLAGEHEAAAAGRAAIVRTSWIFGPGPASNFVNAIRARLASGGTVTVLDDQTDRPTYAKDLALALEAIALRVSSRPAGKTALDRYHVCNRGAATRLEMAVVIRDLLGLERVRIERADRSQIQGRLALRPARPVLSTERFETDFAHPLRDWRDAMREYLGEAAPCAS